jgi:hypothetical protein
VAIVIKLIVVKIRIHKESEGNKRMRKGKEREREKAQAEMCDKKSELNKESNDNYERKIHDDHDIFTYQYEREADNLVIEIERSNSCKGKKKKLKGK